MSGLTEAGNDIPGEASANKQFPPAFLVSPNIGKFVRIEAGTFMMGSPENKADRFSDETRHEVTLGKAFYMAEHEITQERYKAVMGNNPAFFTPEVGEAANKWFALHYKSRFKAPVDEPAEGEIQGKRPVERVSWFDALVFCNTLSMKEGLAPAYRVNGKTNPAEWGSVPEHFNEGIAWKAEMSRDAAGYRLPTEAEWEYACRAGTETVYNSGDVASDDTGWCSTNSDKKTHEVGKKPANRWDLYDMHGNVYEWCWDRHDGFTGDPVKDPEGASSGYSRVIRGGSYDFDARYMRSDNRSFKDAHARRYYIGFRVVRGLS